MAEPVVVDGLTRLFNLEWTTQAVLLCGGLVDEGLWAGLQHLQQNKRQYRTNHTEDMSYIISMLAVP